MVGLCDFYCSYKSDFWRHWESFLYTFECVGLERKILLDSHSIRNESENEKGASTKKNTAHGKEIGRNSQTWPHSNLPQKCSDLPHLFSMYRKKQKKNIEKRRERKEEEWKGSEGKNRGEKRLKSAEFFFLLSHMFFFECTVILHTR